MQQSDFQWQIRVLAGSDTLRAERMTRALHDELGKAEGLDVGFVEMGQQSDNDGHKGGGYFDLALWAAFAAPTAAGTAKVLVTLIQEWCARDRHRKVELTRNGSSVIITGQPDEAQERIVRLLFEQPEQPNTIDEKGDSE